MPKLNWDHENTTVVERFVFGVCGSGLAMLAGIIGISMLAHYTFINWQTVAIVLAVWVAADLYARLWNNYLPWSGDPDD